MDYLSRLKTALIKQNKGKRYQKICIDYASKLISNNLPVVFDKKHLSLLMGINYSTLNYYIVFSSKFYKEFSIKKKNGKYRTINTPSLHLKEVQRWILENLLYKYEVHENAFGFIRGKNIKDNALMHVNQKIVVNLDIKNFFPTIKWNHVYNLFYQSGYSKELSFCLANLCTYDGVLPQGAPTSPYLANLIVKQLDLEISQLIEGSNLKYSRYADDITLSGDSSVTEIVPQVINIIQGHGFEPNYKKFRIQKSHSKEVTGLIVSDRVKVKRKFKRNLEQHIYYASKYGVESHIKARSEEHLSFYKNYLTGMANFIKMIEPEDGEKYLSRIHNIHWN